MDLEQLERNTRTISDEHRQAINTSEETARMLAKADTNYHRSLAVQVAECKAQFGATIAETMAKGHSTVTEAKEAREIAAARDRAAMERVRLARDDRVALLKIADWSKANEATLS